MNDKFQELEVSFYDKKSESLFAHMPSIGEHHGLLRVKGRINSIIFEYSYSNEGYLVYRNGRYRLYVYRSEHDMILDWKKLRGIEYHVKTSPRDDDHEYLADLMSETIQKEIDAEVIASIRSMPIRLI